MGAPFFVKMAMLRSYSDLSPILVAQIFFCTFADVGKRPDGYPHPSGHQLPASSTVDLRATQATSMDGSRYGIGEFPLVRSWFI